MFSAGDSPRSSCRKSPLSFAVLRLTGRAAPVEAKVIVAEKDFLIVLGPDQ
jgi:hypothetical protein